MNVLVVIAHPDDETYGCGGTIAKLTDGGARVTTLLPLQRCDERGRRHWSSLLEGFHAASEILGASARVLEPLMDETLAESHVAQMHDRILPFIEAADLVLTHWPGDVNQVHRGVARAVEIGTRPFRRRRDVRCFEVPTSTDQAFAGQGGFHPNEFVLLDATQVARKRAAIARYPTEDAVGRTADDLERRMRVRGAEAGAEFAEAFVIARQFR